MDVKIYDSPLLRFVGLRALLRKSFDEPNNLSVIAPLWQKVTPIAKKMESESPSNNGHHHEGIHGVERHVLIRGDLAGFQSAEASYYALIPVVSFSVVPEGFEKVEIPSSRVALFTHRGGIETFPETVEKIFGEWLPQSKETIASDYERFFFPKGYHPKAPEPYFHYILSLK